VTGAAHRALILLPEGFEFRRAEMGSGTFTAQGALEMHREQRYAALWNAAYGPHGVIDA